jgi:TatD DNase family protein
MIKLFDSHAHYNDHRFETEFEGGAEGAIKAAFEAGVIGFVNVGTEPENCRESIEIASKYENVYAAVGLHPEDAANFPREDIPRILSEVREMAKNEKVVAIGEIGLDYHWDTPHDLQKEVFEAQLIMARELGLPVIIHNRDAHGDTFEMLSKYPDVVGVMHSYSGSAEMARELVRRGWYISFSGVVTFKNAERVRGVAATIPSDRLLAETDCPYLAPHPNRGKINRSDYMRYTIATLAELFDMSVQEMTELTRKNAERLFHLGNC